MLPVANFQLRNLYDTTVEFFALRSPLSSTASSRDQSPAGQRNSGSLTPVPDPIARLTKKCAALREEADAWRSACASSSSPITGLTLASMRRELDATRKELARTRLEIVKLEERCRSLEKTVRETKELLRVRDAELRSEVSVDTLSSADSSETDHGAMEESQEDRVRRRGEEIFMTRTDSWSGAQVVQAVHDLNSEILQFSAMATELCAFKAKSMTSTSRFNQASKDTAARLGQNVSRMLSTRDHSDPILVQLALQGVLSVCIARALSAFCLGFPSKNDSILSQIYTHMHAAVPQPTSARWRALTHQHCHSIYPYIFDYSVNELAETMYRCASDVFLISGCETNEKMSFATRDGLRARFSEQIMRIARTVCKLSRVMKEEIMSTNFDILAVEPGDKFDSKRMSDAFADYTTSSRGEIFTTTELGLRCSTRSSDGTTDRRMLLLPKVVLCSVLDFLER